MTQRFDIAVIEGDGIGPEVTQAAIRAVEAAAPRSDAAFDWNPYPWGTDYYFAHGKMADDDFLDCRPVGIFQKFGPVSRLAVRAPALRPAVEGLERASGDPVACENSRCRVDGDELADRYRVYG